MNEETKLGLMAREDLAEFRKQYQKKALNNGAKAIVALESVGNMAFKPGILEMNQKILLLRKNYLVHWQWF